MSPDPRTIAWCASYFKNHAAQWRSLSNDMSSAATELRACPPTDPAIWVWPDLARIREELDKAQSFYSEKFVGKAPEVMLEIADKLDETLTNYIAHEANGVQAVIDEVNRRLED